MHRIFLALAGAAALAASPLVLASPAPSDQFRAGQAIYAESCAACHGDTGRGGPGFANPIWGAGASLAKYRTAAGLFEYHQIMMPFDDPTRLADELKWAVTLYLLANHGTVAPDTRLDAANAGGIAIR